MKKYKSIFTEAFSLYDVKKGEVYTRDGQNYFLIVQEAYEGRIQLQVIAVHIGEWINAKPIHHQKDLYKRVFNQPDLAEMKLVKNYPVPKGLLDQYDIR